MLMKYRVICDFSSMIHFNTMMPEQVLCRQNKFSQFYDFRTSSRVVRVKLLAVRGVLVVHICHQGHSKSAISANMNLNLAVGVSGTYASDNSFIITNY
jgi:hypothetical protein